MDQLKQGLAVARKHLFWILVGVVAIMSMVSYFMTSSFLKSDFTKQAQAIDQSYSSVSNVNNEAATHPNEFSHKRMDELVSTVSSDVERAWTSQYARQVRLLQWPTDRFRPEMISVLDKFRPIELSLEYPTPEGQRDPLELTYREEYKNYVKDLFPELAKIIGAKWTATPSASAGGGMGGYGGMGGAMGGGMDDYGGEGGYGGGMMGGTGMTGTTPLEKPPLVDWQGQQELLNQIIPWYGGIQPPTTLQILYTQEDIWVLSGLLQIINKTNEGATENFQASIKTIEWIRMGKTAIGRAGMLDVLAGAASGGLGGMGGYGSEMADGGGEEAPMTYGDETGGGGEGSTGGMGDGYGSTAVSVDPADSRYVDAAYQAIKGDQLRTSMKSGSPEDAYYAVAKRIPVRMRFMMDQRKISKLLSVCGNADLMLEVRQVRINTTAAAMGGAGGGMGSMGGYGGGGGGGGRGMVGMDSGGGGGEGAGIGMGMGAPGGSGMDDYGGEGGYGGYGGGAAALKSTTDIPVEIYGIIYLYNPPNMEGLGLAQVKEDTKLDDSKGVAEPDATVAPAAADPAAEGAPVGDQGAAAAVPAGDAAGAAANGGAANGGAVNGGAANGAGGAAPAAAPANGGAAAVNGADAGSPAAPAATP